MRLISSTSSSPNRSSLFGFLLGAAILAGTAAAFAQQGPGAGQSGRATAGW